MVAQGVFSTGMIETYCTVEDVLAVLSGYDLTPFGSGEAVAERVRELLPLTGGRVDTSAGRDFRWHADETVVLDGSGTAYLLLPAEEVAPPVMVREVRVAGAVVPAANYRVYGETGLVRLKPTATLPTFPAGVGNVEVDLDWGFEQPPGDVTMAQAKLTAAELLAELGGEGGTVQETRIGEYAVRYASGGRYAAAVERLCAEVMELTKRYRRVRVGVV